MRSRPAAIRAGQLAKSIMVFTDDRPAPQARTSKALLASASMKMVLAEMRNSVVHADSMDAAIVKAFGYIRQLTPSRVSAIYEYRRDRDWFPRCTQSTGDPSDLLTGLVISNGDRITGWAGANRQTAINSDAVLDLGPLAELFDPPLRRAISCPIEVDGQTTAVLTASSDCEDGFERNHVDAVEHVSECIAIRLRDRKESEVLI